MVIIVMCKSTMKALMVVVDSLDAHTGRTTLMKGTAASSDGWIPLFMLTSKITSNTFQTRSVNIKSN
uniref:Uncharacterized protein n=1 Tax=Arundo donax TaxID=35708 RepID=A0A0A9U3H9_ARUDO